MKSLFLFGLGNPGSQYALTRHNLGFMAIDALAHSLGADPPKSKRKSEYYDVVYKGYRLYLIKPQTFMNLSFESVMLWQKDLGFEKDQCCVLHDDLDLDFGDLKLQKNRGHGGHNGLRDIHQQLGKDYARFKLGIGRPAGQIPVDRYVLSKFSPQEFEKLPHTLNDFVDSLFIWIEKGYDFAINQINQRSSS